MKGFKEVASKICEAKYILIAGHINPDGDSIGSLLSLGLGLKQLGKKVEMVSCDGVPKMYRQLPGAREIRKHTTKTPDLAIAVDCGNKELLGKNFEGFNKAKCILEIDHHEFREPFGNIHIVKPDVAAVGELVYYLLERLGVDITKDIAQNILTSIIVETNFFRLPNIRSVTFQICAQLLKKGVDFSKLSEIVYWSKTKEASLLVGLCLSKCRFLRKGEIVWSILKKIDVMKVNGKDEDTDSVPNEMLAIKGVIMAIFFREVNGNKFRVSLRGKGKINVATLTRKYDGGGHFDAAGCIISKQKGSIRQFLKHAEDYLTKERYVQNSQ